MAKAKIVMVTSCMALCACTQGFLDVKSDKSLVVPHKIEDFAALLENTQVMNSTSSHTLGIIGSDEYHLSGGLWQALASPYQKNGYVWANEVYGGHGVDDWDNAYMRILRANVVLDGLPSVAFDDGNRAEWDRVKGMALFHRAYNFYQLAQLFCNPYRQGSAEVDPGIPLRLESDVTVRSTRSSVAETYRRIVDDLQSAAPLLDERSPVSFVPTKAAAYAMLARTFLHMGDYGQSLDYAGRCLSIRGDLLDFNDIDTTLAYTFPRHGAGNPEVIFTSYMINATITNTLRFNADTNLLALYVNGDIRKSAYFFLNSDRRVVFKGSYTGAYVFFTGLAVDEALLIRAESHARLGSVDKAMEDLNRLRKHRFHRDLFVPLEADGNREALGLILDERRRELVLRGTRWGELRRFNQEGQFQTTLQRVIEDQVFTLPPNSPRWVWAIPDNVIAVSGMEQNAR